MEGGSIGEEVEFKLARRFFAKAAELIINM
jgi:hypothetical protein